MSEAEGDATEFAAVTSEDGRHSIWPAALPPPWGWSLEGFRGGRAECLAHVAAVWTELRPREVRSA